jgi:RNA polymerase sigma-70 factor (ECF subfamily)
MDTAIICHHRQAAPKREQIFSELYRECYSALQKVLLNKVHETTVAEDIAQEVFLKFWISMDKFHIDDHKAYLFMMARNEAITHLRRLKQTYTVANHFLKHGIEGVNFTDDSMRQKETEVLLQKAIQRLSQQRKRVYLLCKMEGLAYEQVAFMLNISVSTVREVMRISHQQVREFMNLHLNDIKLEPKEKVKKHKIFLANVLQAA